MSLVPIFSPTDGRTRRPGDVLEVAPGSLADVAGIRPGDCLLSINGYVIRDPIDYRFYSSDDRLLILVRRGEDTRRIVVRKHPDHDLGLALPELTLEDIAECNNHCPFCFVTQLPKGMRHTLHIKDDDYRFSFLNASFVTLTNLSEGDWDRIGQQHLSPLYISVHSSNTELRRKLLGNRSAPNILEQIDRLIALGIAVHTQLVLCPGINDTDDLHSTLRDLLQRYPMVRTVAAVPVGLTKVRTERTASSKNPLRRFMPAEAARVLREIRPYQRENTRRLGEPVVYLSDEFYLLARARVPSRSHYGDLSQLENGVGLVRMMLDAWQGVRRLLPVALAEPRHLTLVCGTLIHPILAELVQRLNTVENLQVDLIPVKNRLFGHEVTVSGLLAGEDVLDRLGEEQLGDTVVLPRIMFDRSGTMTLDDLTLNAMQTRLGRKVVLVDGVRDLGRLVA